MFGKKEPVAINMDKIDTIIGRETEIKGTISAKGVIRIDGRAEGQVLVSGDILVGETAFLLAEVKARHITVAGEIRGNVAAEGKLEILSSGKVYGDIQVANLVIGEGAVFKGKCEMTDSGAAAGK